MDGDLKPVKKPTAVKKYNTVERERTPVLQPREVKKKTPASML